MNEPYYQDDMVTLHHGKAIEVARQLDTGSVQAIIGSPPYYGLRDYGHDDQYGSESSLNHYVMNLTLLFGELRRVLDDEGTLWLNLGDSYAGRANAGRKYDGNRGMERPKVMPKRKNTTGDAPFKNLLMVPARVALALQNDGWILRNDIIWRKTNAKPESVKDRVSQTYEHFFLFSKRPKYYFDLDPIRAWRGAKHRDHWDIPNPGDVWDIAVQPFKGAHFATFPEELPRRAIQAGTQRGDTVLDPFSGSGTTGMVAQQLGRKYIGIDVNADYLDLSLQHRFSQPALNMTGEEIA